MRLVVHCGNGDFLGNRKVILFWILPIDEPDRDGVFTHIWPHLHAIAQQLIHGAIAVIEAFAGVVRRLFQFVEHLADEFVLVALLLQPRAQPLRLDVAVFLPVFPVAQVGIAQRVAEQLHHALLGLALFLADGAHVLRNR